MNQVYLSFGSNVGERSANIETALRLLDNSAVKIKQLSSLYDTEPWGNTTQSAFMNMAGIFDTTLSPVELIRCILDIENSMGRQRIIKWEPRIIDIDILLFGNKIINENGLIIPHPEMRYRKFVLMPLAEIAPDVIHPVLNKPIKKLLMECEDELQVAIVPS
ncbi:MAG: 2-amino-4-hydroxy-6-hydroxymethyldihydropteridine diphosphokinase [Bacteroidia bacterium]|nr:2-amino-4-hydroxy-6-hydroxymethyldihydropteridine diphosphokinase [Bacteroidia bacterium]